MKQTYHFVGIGGIGMSALAWIALQRGMRVTGSDVASSRLTERLGQEGAKIAIGHDANNFEVPSTVVYSTVIDSLNPEIARAQRENQPLLHRSDLLHAFTEGYRTLGVTGSHGKTTTSSLLTTVLRNAQWDPSYAIGGMLLDGGGNGGAGKGDFFVLEADESDGSFLRYTLDGAIVTNIDNDHLDHHGTVENLVAAFQKFMMQMPSKELLFWCNDDPTLSLSR